MISAVSMREITDNVEAYKILFRMTEAMLNASIAGKSELIFELARFENGDFYDACNNDQHRPEVEFVAQRLKTRGYKVSFVPQQDTATSELYSSFVVTW